MEEVISSCVLFCVYSSQTAALLGSLFQYRFRKPEFFPWKLFICIFQFQIDHDLALKISGFFEILPFFFVSGNSLSKMNISFGSRSAFRFLQTLIYFCRFMSLKLSVLAKASQSGREKKLTSNGQKLLQARTSPRFSLSLSVLRFVFFFPLYSAISVDLV